MRHGPNSSPRFVWDCDADTAFVNGRACNAAGVFVRHDVFAGLQDPRPEHAMRAYAWFQAVHGWASAHNGVRLFNAHATAHGSNKAAMLFAAVEAGLQVPSTVITNLESGRFTIDSNAPLPSRLVAAITAIR